MKNIKYILSFTILFLSSCNSFLDINQDPTKPTPSQVDPGTIFATTIIDFSTNNLSVRNNEYSLFVQHLKRLNTNPRAEIYKYSTYANSKYWNNVYYSMLLLSRVEKKGAEENHANVQAQAKVMKAMITHMAVDRWGDIPYSEAVNEEIKQPKFDDAKEIYYKLYDLLNEATDLFSEESNETVTPYAIVGYDPLFYGNIEKWIRFANSLKLRILMRLSSVDDVSSQLSTLINSKMIDDNMYNASFKYYGGKNKNADFLTYEAFSSRKSFYVDPIKKVRRHTLWKAGSKSLLDQMNTLNDPRRFSYFDRHYESGIFLNTLLPLKGTQNGKTPNPPAKEMCFLSMYYMRGDKSDEFFRASETHLLLAEAYAKGYITGGISKAKEHVDKGIENSMKEFDGFSYLEKKYTIKEADITAYIASIDLSSEPIKKIQLQQYIAQYSNGAETWANWRRTKVPALTAPTGAIISTMISRIVLPQEEILTNKNAPKDKKIDEPIFFEKK